MKCLEKVPDYDESKWRKPTSNYVPCVRCGRPVDPSKTDGVHLDVMLNMLSAEDGIALDPGDDLGWHPIGKDCIGKVMDRAERKLYLASKR